MLVSLLAQADSFYYRLYYCLELARRVSNHSSQIPSIPEPSVYFTEYAVDVVQLNGELKAYIAANFSEAYKRHISEVFGFLDSASPPFQHNPLLLLHFARWRESVCFLTRRGLVSASVPSLLALCSSSASPSSSSAAAAPHASMKKRGDPLLPPATRLWNDSCRVWACHLYAYATPSPAALDALARHAPLLEIGAGTGYWASCLRLRHPAALLHAYDKDPPSAARAQRSNGYHGRAAAWTSVLRGGVEAVARHAQATLFLCYPPPDSGAHCS